MDKNTLTEIAQDKEFIKKLVSQDTDEGFKNILGEKNINVSLEDAKEIRTQLNSAIKGNVNLTDEELEIINGGSASVGDAIKYTVKTAVALALVAGTVKFGIDVYGNVEDRVEHPIKAGTKDVTGWGKDKSTYGRAVDKTGEAIVKGFGLDNGKLF